MKTAIRVLLAIPLLLVVFVGGLYLYVNTDHGRGVVVDLVNGFAGAEGGVRLGAIEGHIPFDMTVRDLSVADRQGDWLTIDEARLAWSPQDLVSRTLRIVALEAGTIAVSRLPAGEARPETDEPAAGMGFPDLPVDIVLERLVVDRLSLAEPVAGQAGELGIEASARLGDPARGLVIAADIRRLDGVAADLIADIVFVPETEDLSVDVRLTEEPGGMLGTLLDLPNDQALSLRADGTGTLSSFNGELLMDGGDDLGADIQVSLDRSADPDSPDGSGDIRLTLDGWAVPLALLPEAFAPLAGDRVTLSADATIGDQSIDLETLAVEAGAGRLTLGGRMARDGSDLALTYGVETGDSTPFAALLPPNLAWERLTVDGTANGPLMTPQIDFQTELTAGRFSDPAIGYREVGYRGVGDLFLSGTLIPDRPVTDPGMRLEFNFDAGARDLAVGMPVLDQMLAGDPSGEGRPVTLSTAGVVTRAGDMALDGITLTTPFGALAVSGVVEDFGSIVNASAELSIDELSSLGDLAAGLGLEGAFGLQTTIARAEGETEIDLSGELTAFRTGIGPADGLLGSDVALAAEIGVDHLGRVTIPSLTIDGSETALRASASYDGGAVGGTVTLSVAQLAALNPAISGGVTLEAGIGGSVSTPTIELSLASERIEAADRAVEALSVTVSEIDLSALTARLAATARVDGLPVSIETMAGYDGAAGKLSFGDIDIAAASAEITGDLDLFLSTLTAEGQISASAPDLSRFQDLAGMPLFGDVTADIGLSQSAGGQDADIDARFLGLVVDGNRVGQGTVSGSIMDVTGTPAADLTIALRDVDAAGQALSRLDIDLSGDPGTFDVGIDAAGPDVTLAAGAGITLPQTADAPLEVALQRLRATYQGEPVTLASPSTITVRDGAVTIGQTTLTIRDGRLSVAGTVGDRIDLRGSLTDIPLTIIDRFAGEQGITGRLSGSFSAAGTIEAPTATLDLAARNVQSAAARDFGLSAASADLTARWDGQRVQANADATLPGGTLTAQVSLPMTTAGPPAGAALQGSVDGAVDLSLLNPLLAGGGDRVAGRAVIDIALGGALTDPDISGAIRVDGGAYENPLTGIDLSGIELVASAVGDVIRIDTLTARTPGGGQLTGSGSVNLDVEAGMPVDIRLTANRAQPITTPFATPTLDADLTFTGQFLAETLLSGTVTLRDTTVTVPDRLPATIRTIEVRERNVPPGRGRGTQTDGAGQGRPQQAPGDADAGPGLLQRIGLDLRVTAPGGIFVRGRGLDAEMGGDIRVVGTAASPAADGGFTMRRGRLNFLGNNFDFDRGEVRLDGDALGDPILDFAAVAPIGDNVTATISVTGRASDPQINFFSDPPLPQDEVLARILFGRATSDLNAFQALQLAQSLGQLAGFGDQGNVIDDVRRAVGLDRLDLDLDDAAAGGGVSITAGQFLTEDVFVGVRQSASGSSRVAVEIDVTDNIKIDGDVGTDRSRVGVRFEWEY